jgi:hypothetical protein
MHTCYLIGFIDKNTLKVVDVGIYNESGRTFTTKNSARFPFDITKWHGDTFHEACKNMVAYLQSPVSRHLDWVKQLLQGKI